MSATSPKRSVQSSLGLLSSCFTQRFATAMSTLSLQRTSSSHYRLINSSTKRCSIFLEESCRGWHSLYVWDRSGERERNSNYRGFEYFPVILFTCSLLISTSLMSRLLTLIQSSVSLLQRSSRGQLRTSVYTIVNRIPI